MSSLRWKICTTPEWLAIRTQKHRKRPPALLSHGTQRSHIDLIDIGSFLAVDLNIDEQRVHDAGNFRVFERLMRHDVAPVAGSITNR